MGQPETVAALLRGDKTFSHDVDGSPITRAATCECGQPFVQILLSDRFLTIVERQSRRAIDNLGRQIPGFFVPVFCPSCERKDLGMQARRDEYSQVDEPGGEHGAQAA